MLPRSRIVDENKVKGYALSMIQDPVEPNLIFVGTENGLWVSLDNGNTYEQWKNGYPSVSTYDLAIQEREADLVIGTFGRALWILDDIRPLRKLAADQTKIASNTITVFPAPEAYQAQYRAAPGYEWSTWGLWDADNKRRGAAISFFVNKPKDTSRSAGQPAATQPATGQPAASSRFGQGAAGRRGDSATVRIYNANNELIRTLRWSVDSGFNRQYWGMEEKGFRNPVTQQAGTIVFSSKPQPGAPEPGGFQVLPGTYKVVVNYSQAADSTFVTIKDDPRLGNRNEIKLAQRKMYDRLRKSAEKLIEAGDRLAEAEEVINKVQAQLRGVEGKEADSLRKTSTKILDEIKAIRESALGKASDKQGISRSPFDVTVVSQMQQAQQIIGSKMIAPGAQEETMVANAEKSVGDFIQRVNNFFETKWKDYRAQVEATKVNLFKDYKPL